MKTLLTKLTASILLTVVCATAGLIIKGQSPTKPIPKTDIKIRQRMTMGAAATTETVLYIKGQRMRNEMASGNMGMTTILQCDLKRTLTINEQTKTYLISPTDGTNAPASDGGGVAPTGPNQPSSSPTRGGVVNVTHTVTDTGERKEMFGFTARHIKTSMVKTVSPDACDKDQKVETDGWYIDFQYAFDCSNQPPKYQPSQGRPQPGCKDEIRMKTIGTAKLGFPLIVTTTIYMPDGRTTSMTQEVLELSREPLSASLFDIPEGYTLAKDMQALYGMGPNVQPTNSASVQPTTPGGSSSASVASTTNNSTTVANASTPKKAGTIRIGLVLPPVQMNAGNPAQAAEAVRNTFASYLTGPTIEVVMLSARLPALAMDEAKQSQCDYLLSSSLTIKKGGGGGSLFGRAIGSVAGTAAGHVPGGGSAATGAVRSAAITGIYTTAAIASSIKAKDELSLEYKLESTDGARPGVANTAKGKAKSDGEDVLTPLIEKAAEAVVGALKK
jgi:hypothetical protein